MKNSDKDFVGPPEPPPSYRPPFVLSIHGIRTAAAWQKDFDELLASKGFDRFKAIDYGNYRLLRFLQTSQNEQMVEEFSNRYSQLMAQHNERVSLDDYKRRPSIIAHSFGTYIVGRAMLKYPDIRFDKIILCGSILPDDFDWGTLLARDQVDCVRNEYGSMDIWARLVRRFISMTGNSGYKGFDFPSTSIVQQEFEFYHSDFFPLVTWPHTGYRSSSRNLLPLRSSTAATWMVSKVSKRLPHRSEKSTTYVLIKSRYLRGSTASRSITGMDQN